MSRIKFEFEFDGRFVKHLKEISFYNHNYYEIDLDKHGDLFHGKCNVIFEHYDESTNSYSYSLGYFDSDGFVTMFTWLADEAVNFSGIGE